MLHQLVLTLIIAPILAGVAIFIIPARFRGVKEALALAVMFVDLVIAIVLFRQGAKYSVPWAPFGIEFSINLYHFSALTVLAAAFFGFLILLYSSVSLFDKSYAKQFYSYFLISFGFINGAVLADNLIVFLFFWEGLLLTLFGMIAIGGKAAFKTATKSLIIVGVSDLFMMVGIALAGYLAGTFTISAMSISIAGLGGLAFIFLMIGAIAKGGSMPFHSWIPDAAIDAPLPFMALMPGALEKLLGIYFLTRISLDIFKLEPNSWVSYTLMIIGAITILLAVMMALVQKDYKRLLSYHAISQLGYMILGVGTLVPAGIVGGLFHMINNALYKSCLFLTGGSVEKEAGTTDLEKLGGMGRKMPVTFICFAITALAISGVPPFNGFFSKELVYDGALERGWIFYIAAVLGSFFTAASFLKLGHAAYLGKLSEKNRGVKEAPVAMLIPMVVIAFICILFGLWNALPLNNLIQPILGEHRLEGHTFAGMPHNMTLILITVLVLLGALANHIYGVKRTGSGAKAVDHIHYAPVLSAIYDRAEKRWFDPYDIVLKIVNVFSATLSRVDKAVDWVYEVFAVRSMEFFSNTVRRLHNGNYGLYIIWSIAGAAAILIFLLKQV